ncbi:histidinol-phosphatase HisJ family protein [Halothermothrix orenii]|uniref:Histidinol-phosphatase n=1 Tax=Halothermothrix orenii (strain H 168 / OCM 544 / DSM 9562) TaxID=373903 RepID=B8CX85_HALOH|nr:histidinol-phosphatase HisJ family protein [Halothermothrix orenii]ACL69904.1 histidinol-phosphatase [Halothermothrix orenii H 168]
MYLVDYHTHPYAHGEDNVKPAHNFDYLKKFLKMAKVAEVKEIGFSDHDRFIDEINWDNLLKFKEKNKNNVKLGLEIDFSPDRIDDIKKIIKEYPLDYTIGSVHRIGDWEVDHPVYIEEYHKRDLITVYKQYFELVKEAASSGLFNIIGHIDLIKIFNIIPPGINMLEMVEPALEVIKKRGLAIEINTNGLNKPVNEIYPSLSIIKRIVKMGIPLTLGSDAHGPKRVGENLKLMGNLLLKNGCQRIATFTEKKMKMIRIK